MHPLVLLSVTQDHASFRAGNYGALIRQAPIKAQAQNQPIQQNGGKTGINTRKTGLNTRKTGLNTGKTLQNQAFLSQPPCAFWEK
jgi:hypothetical protein